MHLGERPQACEVEEVPCNASMHGLALQGEYARALASGLDAAMQLPKARGGVAHKATKLQGHLSLAQAPATHASFEHVAFVIPSDLQPALLTLLCKLLDCPEHGEGGKVCVGLRLHFGNEEHKLGVAEARGASGTQQVGWTCHLHWLRVPGHVPCQASAGTLLHDVVKGGGPTGVAAPLAVHPQKSQACAVGHKTPRRPSG
mmetsp:Transcript_93021/g.199499  ORF Transcript_93021/g.199499 Transcript_93021/m.199499 type:complete len:201 (+) Transcript_93021:500-1102(+)